MYIYQNKNWPKFVWDKISVLDLLAEVRFKQGLLLGRMENIGFTVKNEALLASMTEEIIRSGKIEGELLDTKQVRSSVARKLGIKNEDRVYVSENVRGFVDIIYDAVHNFDKPVTKKRLCDWQSMLFPGKNSGIYKIKTGDYRDDKLGPMQIVSGPMGLEKVHYQAPDAISLDKEMSSLIKFINDDESDDIIKAAVVHLWFVILHPFDDGNGRIARALTELMLARSERSSDRFYSMSSQIEKNRKAYYGALRITSDSSLDITSWMRWFLITLGDAIENSEILLKNVLRKSDFWSKHNAVNLNERQSKIINMLLDNFRGNLTSSKWAKINGVSQDTAGRDIAELVKMNILEKSGAGRNTRYKLNI